MIQMIQITSYCKYVWVVLWNRTKSFEPPSAARLALSRNQYQSRADVSHYSSTGRCGPLRWPAVLLGWGKHSRIVVHYVCSIAKRGNKVPLHHPVLIEASALHWVVNAIRAFIWCICIMRHARNVKHVTVWANRREILLQTRGKWNNYYMVTRTTYENLMIWLFTQK